MYFKLKLMSYMLFIFIQSSLAVINQNFLLSNSEHLNFYYFSEIDKFIEDLKKLEFEDKTILRNFYEYKFLFFFKKNINRAEKKVLKFYNLLNEYINWVFSFSDNKYITHTVINTIINIDSFIIEMEKLSLLFENEKQNIDLFTNRVKLLDNFRLRNRILKLNFDLSDKNSQQDFKFWQYAVFSIHLYENKLLLFESIKLINEELKKIIIDDDY